MNFENDGFNLLPWREKKIKNKLILHVALNIFTILTFVFIVFFVNKFFNRVILNKRNRLLNFNNNMRELKAYNKKIAENKIKKIENFYLNKKIENNQNNIKMINCLINDISSSISSSTFILYFSIDKKNFILRGKAEKENEIFSLVKRLNKNKYIKNIYLKDVNRKPNKTSITFEINMILKSFYNEHNH